MASIFKRGNAKSKEDIYWIAYSPLPNVRKLVRGCKDLAATKALAAKLESEKWNRRKGLTDSREAAYARAEAIPLATHIEDFACWLEGRNATAQHVQMAKMRVRAIADSCGTRISHLNLSKAQEALKQLLTDGLGPGTANAYATAAKSFGKWLVRDGRAREDAFAHLQRFNARLDRRHDRRALTDPEIERLLTAARNGGTVEGVPGAERTMLYAVALGSGFRANELRNLTRESFKLDDVPPKIIVAAAYSKHRRTDEQPIPQRLADVLRPWLAAKAPGRRVFRVPHRTADMLKVDLAAARAAWLSEAGTREERARWEQSDFLAYRDEDGRCCDFHGLRHTYVSRLALSRAPVKVIMGLARHSDPKLTLSVYSHIGDGDKAAALDELRPLGIGAISCADSSARPLLLPALRRTALHNGEEEGGIARTQQSGGLVGVNADSVGVSASDSYLATSAAQRTP